MYKRQILDSMLKTKQSYLKLNSGTQRPTQIVNVKKQDKEDSVENSLNGFSHLFSKPLMKRVKKLFKNQQEFILDPQYEADYVIPVSYTHLDVYKRQVFSILSNMIIIQSSNSG